MLKIHHYSYEFFKILKDYLNLIKMQVYRSKVSLGVPEKKLEKLEDETASFYITS